MREMSISDFASRTPWMKGGGEYGEWSKGGTGGLSGLWVKRASTVPLTHYCPKPYTSGMYHHPSSRLRLQSPERIDLDDILRYSFKLRYALFSHVD